MGPIGLEPTTFRASTRPSAGLNPRDRIENPAGFHYLMRGNTPKCPEHDSNVHALTGTATSRLCVYRFHHRGEAENGGHDPQRRSAEPVSNRTQHPGWFILRCVCEPTRRLENAVPPTGFEPVRPG